MQAAFALPSAGAASFAAAPSIAKTGNATKAKQTAEDFESFFVSQMIEHMWSGIEPDALFGGGSGEETFRSLLAQEYGRSIAKRGGMGIADAVQREILKLQEV